MTEAEEGTERARSALDAARDLLKQLVTIDAALLTFGVGFLQNISKGKGPADWLLSAVAAILASIFFGVVALYAVVEQTHSSGGNINNGWLRFNSVASWVAFIWGTISIGIFVALAPIKV
jgi:hypothetical protein